MEASSPAARAAIEPRPRDALSPSLVAVAQKGLLAAFAVVLAATFALEPLGLWIESTSARTQVALGVVAGVLSVTTIVLRLGLTADRRPWWTLIAVGVAAAVVARAAAGLAPPPDWGAGATGVVNLAAQLLVLVGVAGLVFPIDRARLREPGLLVAALGLAALWSWLVVEPASEQGGVGVVAGATVLGLMLAVVVVFASKERSRCSETLIATGAATVLGIAGCLNLAGHESVLDEVWPLGVAGFGLAVLLGGRWTERPLGGDNFAFVLGASAIAVAVALLLADHFARVPLITVLLATAALIAAVRQLVALRDVGRTAERRAEEAAQKSRRASEVALHARRSLSERTALHAAALTAALDCVITIDDRGRIIEWNETATRIFGYARDQVLDRALVGLLVPERLRARHQRSFARALANPDSPLLAHAFQTVAMDADGTELPIVMRVVRTSTEPPILTAFIREREVPDAETRSRGELEAMVESAEDAMISSTVDGVITHWNEAAEQLLGYEAREAVGSKLPEVMIPPELRDERDEMLERVRVGESVEFETRRVRKDGEEIDVSMRLFPITEAGAVVGAGAIVRDITERLLLAERQRRRDEEALWDRRMVEALESNGFEFHAQPVVDPRTGALDHYELLLRMNLAGQTVPPGEFLPFAESSGLIRRIDMWAIDRGFELARLAPVAINLSAKSFSNDELLTRIVERMSSAAVDPGRVTFEITETAAAENLEAATELFAALQHFGFGVSLDDFGTGYGSFRYLKHLAVSELKIDIEFVRDLAADPQESRVIRSIVDVAKNFGMRTVAEGVEDEQTLARLIDLDVDLVQGYLFARPQPADEVMAVRQETESAI